MPSRIRLGVWNDAGTNRVAVEIANDGAYWTSYTVDLYSHHVSSSSISGWTTASGAFPGSITNVTVVPQAGQVVQDNAGNVGIGTTNPQAKLDVQGPVRTNKDILQSDGTNGFVMHSRPDTSYDFWQLAPISGSVDRAKGITLNRSTGNVGIGTTNPQAKLDVAGAVKATKLNVSGGQFFKMNLNHCGGPCA